MTEMQPWEELAERSQKLLCMTDDLLADMMRAASAQALPRDFQDHLGSPSVRTVANMGAIGELISRTSRSLVVAADGPDITPTAHIEPLPEAAHRLEVQPAKETATTDTHSPEVQEFEWRKRLITAGLRLYQQHPEVTRALRDARINDEPLSAAMDDEAMWRAQVDRYATLDRQTMIELYEHIEDALPACENLISGRALTAEEDATLIRMATAHTLLFYSNLRLVAHVIRPYRGTLEYADLLEIGCAGLANGLIRKCGAKEDYSGLLSRYISGEVQMALERISPMGTNSFERRKLRELRTLTKKLQAAGIEPTDEAIVEHSEGKLTPKSLQQLKHLQKTLVVSYLADVVAEGSHGGEVTVEDFITDPGQPPEAHLEAEAKTAREAVAELLKHVQLPATELFVIGLHLNIDPRTFEAAGAPLVATFKKTQFDYATVLREHGLPEGLPLTDISRLFGYNLGVAGTYYQRGLKRLRKALE